MSTGILIVKSSLKDIPRIYKISKSKKLLNRDLGTNNKGSKIDVKEK